ncbi:tetratricopeptide repeat protein [Candidatus Saganbacteria bacterium]|nr:tetratricopeptide repeat protein [Candidatus Saganbacteria bacterium]
MKKITSRFDWQNSRVFALTVEIVFLALIFLLPTIFDRRLGIVFSGTKVAFLRLFVIIILTLWSLKLVITRPYGSSDQNYFIRTPLDWPILSFLFCATIAALSSIHVYTSLVGFYGRYEGLTTWYLFGLLFFVVTNYLKNIVQLKRVIITVTSAATLSAVYSMLQRFSLDPYMWGGVITWQRVIGMIGQPNFLAAYMLMAFFLILAMLLLDKKESTAAFDWSKQVLPLLAFLFIPAFFCLMIFNLEAYNIVLWYVGFTLLTAAALIFAYTYEQLHPKILNIVLTLALFLSYICILYTQSRGGYMGLMTGLALFALVAGRQVLFANWRKFLICGGLIFLISGITMLQPEFSPFERFTSEITTKPASGPVQAVEKAEAKLELKGAAGSRGETWKSALGIIADNPLFGVGPEVLKMVFPRYETDLFRFKEAFHVKQDRCHNETFDVSVTKGLIAFFVYIWLIFTFFKVGWRKASGSDDLTLRLLLAGLLSAGLAYLIQNQFSFGVIAITSIFWIIMGMVMIIGENEPEEKVIKINWLELPWINAAVIVVIAALLSYVSFYSFRGDIWFKSGKTKMETGNFKGATGDLQVSLKIFPFEGTAISHLGIAYLNQANVAAVQRGQNIDAAIKTLWRGTQVDAYNADNFYLLAKIYFMGGDMAKALAGSEKAIKIDPYYAEVFHLMGLIDVRLGRFEAARQNFTRAFMINPNLAEPLAELERLNNQLGQPAETLKFFESALQRYSDNLVLLEQVARRYIIMGRAVEAQTIANRMVALDPKVGSGYLVRGIALKSLGSADLALGDFQQAIMIDPKNIAAHIELGQLYLAHGEPARAREELEQALSLDPNNAAARRILTRLR